MSQIVTFYVFLVGNNETSAADSISVTSYAYGINFPGFDVAIDRPSIYAHEPGGDLHLEQLSWLITTRTPDLSTV
jgi:hypothetical protein